MTRKPEPTPAEIGAVRALVKGEADEEQQRIGMEFIMRDLCIRLGSAYEPGDDGRRETDFNLGRQFVGIWVGRIAHDPEVLREAQEREAQNKGGKS